MNSSFPTFPKSGAKRTQSRTLRILKLTEFRDSVLECARFAPLSNAHGNCWGAVSA
jgi:hypothetical protein